MLTISDWAIVLATFSGPIAAVQVQEFIDARKSIKERRRAIFRTLMATRASRVSQQHVDALNAIPLEFHGRAGINEQWKVYFDHLNSAPDPVTDVWLEGWKTHFIKLMYLIARDLGYRFSEVELKNDVYWPKAHESLWKDQEAIRRGLAEVLAGTRALPMELKSIPATATQEALQRQDQIQQALLRWLDGKASVTIEIKPDGAAK